MMSPFSHVLDPETLAEEKERPDRGFSLFLVFQALVVLYVTFSLVIVLIHPTNQVKPVTSFLPELVG